MKNCLYLFICLLVSLDRLITTFLYSSRHQNMTVYISKPLNFVQWVLIESHYVYCIVEQFCLLCNFLNVS